MKKLISTLFMATLTLSTYSALAADQTNNQTNTEDAKEGLIQDDTMNQSMDKTMEQSSTSTKKDKNAKKNMAHKNRKGNHSSANKSTDYKMMDSNSDGMISKDEYMMHHDSAYGKMKQTNGSVSLKDMNAQMNIGTTKGNKIQPSSPTGVPPDAMN